jgi:hypothetical protein
MAAPGRLREPCLGDVVAVNSQLTSAAGIKRQRDITTISLLMAYRSANAELKVPAQAPMLTM